ncbi:MAG: hypothetical protein M3Z46_11085 [Actinomycetota bacterium]|nr:hypothetical protein [Actinomycetota bacterium]
MPDETLIWTDVRFDQQAAHQAAAECERAARILRDVAHRRRGLADRALVNGRGPWREQLVAQMSVIDRRSDEMETGLRGLARALIDASARARFDQSQREAARTSDLGHSSTLAVPE